MQPTKQSDLDQAKADCQLLVKRRARISAGAAVIPLPGVDMLTDVMVFSELLDNISRRFGLAESQLARLDPASRKYILLAASRVGSDLIGRMISKQLAKWVAQKLGKHMVGKAALRFVPFAGQAIAASLSYRAVVQLGNAHIEDCYRVAQTLLARPIEPEGQA